MLRLKDLYKAMDDAVLESESVIDLESADLPL